MNKHHLIETRAAKMAELKTPSLSQERFDALTVEVRALDSDLKRIATVEALDNAANAAPEIRASDIAGYSVAKAIEEAENGSLTGLEREMHDTLSKGRGQRSRGVMIPSSIIFGEQRAMLTSGSAGNTVPTVQGELIDRLRPAMKVAGLGATVLTGLTGNIELPKMTGSGTAYWLDEDAPTTQSDATFDKVELAPRTVSGAYYMSRRLSLMNGVGLEDVLRRDLSLLLAGQIDKAAISGTAAAKQPVGILSAIVENATAETELSDIAADLIAALELDEQNGDGAFLTNPALLATVRKMRDTTGRLLPISEVFHGKRVEATNQVAAVGGKNPLIYGHWSDLIIASWSGIDVLPDRYSGAAKGGLTLWAFADVDVAVRHEESFSYKLVA